MGSEGLGWGAPCLQHRVQLAATQDNRLFANESQRGTKEFMRNLQTFSIKLDNHLLLHLP